MIRITGDTPADGNAFRGAQQAEAAILDHVTLGVRSLTGASRFCAAFVLDPDGHNIEAVCHQ